MRLDSIRLKFNSTRLVYTPRWRGREAIYYQFSKNFWTKVLIRVLGLGVLLARSTRRIKSKLYSFITRCLLCLSPSSTVLTSEKLLGQDGQRMEENGKEEKAKNSIRNSRKEWMTLKHAYKTQPTTTKELNIKTWKMFTVHLRWWPHSYKIISF